MARKRPTKPKRATASAGDFDTTGGLSQAEVAVSVGFYDQSQLHRHFKRILGLTPGAFACAVR